MHIIATGSDLNKYGNFRSYIYITWRLQFE